MKEKMRIEDFFKKQFKHKVHLFMRLILLTYLLIEQIGQTLALTSIQYIFVEGCCLLLALMVIPIFDVFFLKDPLNANTNNPLKYWLFALIGDYQQITDGLIQRKQQANAELEVAHKIYQNKLKRKQQEHPETTVEDPLGNIESSIPALHPFKPNIRPILIASLVVTYLIYGTGHFFELKLMDYPVLDNMGFRLVLAAFIVFKVIPFIEVCLFKTTQHIGWSNGYDFWQYVWMGPFDQSIKKLSVALAQINMKTNLLKKASEQLEESA